MKVWTLRIAVALALISAGFYAGRVQLPVVHGQEQSSDYLESTVPLAWGHVVAAGGSSIIFEDGIGTVRTYNIVTHKLVGQIKRK